MTRSSFAILLLLFAASLSSAAAPPRLRDTVSGDRALHDYFRRQAESLGTNSLNDIRTRADWERRRPELHRQLLDMLGLWPMPPRTELKATITGRHEAPTFTVEKLHFQSRPGLYVTGTVYLPVRGRAPYPTILYLCGHSPQVIDGVPYGNKVAYQRHGAWFAENGYVCLMLDTLQLGEVPGLHHGTHHLGMWWWQCLGYTPAGVETWNAIRGLDYLISREDVDSKRIGVTGRSGGGAISWYTAAADERISCIVPVAGIADLKAQLCEGYPGRLHDGVIAGHCDCMFFINTYQWDFSKIMALCAPRPLLLGNSDLDDIFPVNGYRRMEPSVRRIYALHGASEKFGLLETHGYHKDTPELRQGAFRWMNRWLKNNTDPISDPDRALLDPKVLKVFDRLPTDSVNDVIHETFVRAARPELPQVPAVTREWWKGQSQEWRDQLLDHSFRGWPKAPPALDVKPGSDTTHENVRVRAFDFTSDEGIALRLCLVTHIRVERPGEVIVSVVDEPGWQEWVRDLGPAFRDVLYGKGNGAPMPYPGRDEARFAQHRRAMESYKWAFAIVAPRGIGPTRWSEAGSTGTHIRRRFPLLGQTLDGMRVWDVRRALATLRTLDTARSVPVTLQGKNHMAGVALYAGLFEPDVAAFDLWNPPASHREGPTLLNVLRILDMPQAVALSFPRKVRLHVKEDATKEWDWPMRLDRELGTAALQIRKGE
jgi:Prolyl oligopeptidase family